MRSDARKGKSAYEFVRCRKELKLCRNACGFCRESVTNGPWAASSLRWCPTRAVQRVPRHGRPPRRPPRHRRPRTSHAWTPRRRVPPPETRPCGSASWVASILPRQSLACRWPEACCTLEPKQLRACAHAYVGANEPMPLEPPCLVAGRFSPRFGNNCDTETR